MRINTKRASLVTHEGARAPYISVLAQLRRSVLSCLLWESEFYEDGEEISKRIADLTAQCLPEDVAALAQVRHDACGRGSRLLNRRSWRV